MKLVIVVYGLLQRILTSRHIRHRETEKKQQKETKCRKE